MNKIRQTITKLLVAVFIITNILAIQPGMSFAKSDAKDNSKKPANTFVYDRDKTEVLVKYKSGDKETNVKARMKDKLKLTKLETKKKFKKQRIDLYEIDKTDDINQVLEQLKNDTDVEYAQPNLRLNISAAPADPRFNEQWGLLNNGQDVEGQLGRSGVDINAINAWNLTQGSQAVTIGVLDTPCVRIVVV